MVEVEVVVEGLAFDGAVGLVTPDPIGFVGGFRNVTDEEDDEDEDEDVVGGTPLCATEDPDGS